MRRGAATRAADRRAGARRPARRMSSRRAKRYSARRASYQQPDGDREGQQHRPHHQVKVGDRIVIPGVRAPQLRCRRSRRQRCRSPASAPARLRSAAPQPQPQPQRRRRSRPQPRAAARRRPRDVVTPAADKPEPTEGQAGRDRRDCRLPLAGARPRHHRLRSEAERPAERRHQRRGAGRHADQGRRGRRRRLCGQRAEGLRQSRAGAPLERLRHRLCACQRADGEERRDDQARPGDRQGRPDRQRDRPQLHFEIRKGATPVDPTQF